MAKFTVKNIPTIEGETDYEAMNEITQLLYANAATLYTPQGGGHHGHISVNLTGTPSEPSGTQPRISALRVNPERADVD